MPHTNTIVPSDDRPTLRDWMNFCEREFLIDALTMSRGNIAWAGRILGLRRNHLSKKLKDFGINSKKYGNGKREPDFVREHKEF